MKARAAVIRSRPSGVLESIKLEREPSAALRDKAADVVFDYGSELNIHELRDRLVELFSSGPMHP